MHAMKTRSLDATCCEGALLVGIPVWKVTKSLGISRDGKWKSGIGIGIGSRSGNENGRGRNIQSLVAAVADRKQTCLTDGILGDTLRQVGKFEGLRRRRPPGASKYLPRYCKVTHCPAFNLATVLLSTPPRFPPLRCERALSNGWVSTQFPRRRIATIKIACISVATETNVSRCLS